MKVHLFLTAFTGSILLFGSLFSTERDLETLPPLQFHMPLGESLTQIMLLWNKPPADKNP